MNEDSPAQFNKQQQQLDTLDRAENNVAVDDLVAHFENFNMEDLGATGTPVLQRSLTERQGLSP